MQQHKFKPVTRHLTRFFVGSGLTVALTLGMAANAMAADGAPVADLSSETLGERLARLERLMQTNLQSRLSFQQQLDTLLQEVNELRGANEVHGHKLEQLVERQRELYQELEDRFSRFSKIAEQQAQVTQPAVLPSAIGSTAAVNYSGSISENEAYDRAMNLVLKERKYDQAVPEFKAFIEKFPDSAYKPNAYYWLGQLLFNKGEYVQAQSQFEQVVNFFPDSNKRPDAILKLGSIALKRNDKAAAKVFFDKVIAEYPGSSSANLATSRLQSM